MTKWRVLCLIGIPALGYVSETEAFNNSSPPSDTNAIPVSSPLANPTSTLTLTSATTAYSAGQLIASSATAGSVVVPSITLPASNKTALIPRVRLTSNDATSTAWPSVGIQIDLWTTAPTFANGDRASWSVATGSASHLGAYLCMMSAASGDGYYAECAPTVGTSPAYALAGSTIYWTSQAVIASGVTGASKVFTLTAETVQ